MRRALVSLSVAGFVLTGFALHAEEGLPKPKELFQKLDENKDGVLSSDEIPKEQARFFERLLRKADGDNDGKLTLDEFIQGHADNDRPSLPLTSLPLNGLSGAGRPPGQGGLRQRFDKLDRNKDGKITRDEIPDGGNERLGAVMDRLGKDELTLDDLLRAERAFDAFRGQDPEKLFARLDRNGDEKLSMDDVPAGPTRIMVQQFLRRTGKPLDAEVTKSEFLEGFAAFSDSAPEPGPGPGPGPDGERPRPPRFFELLDADRNGRLSRSELAQAAAKFSELDRNGDGELDPRELFGPPPDRLKRDRIEMTERDRETERDEMPRPGASGLGGIGRQFFNRLDRNRDGKISQDEAPPRLKDRFGQLDADNDGYLTPEEFRNAGPGRNRPESPTGAPRPKRPAAE